MTTTAVPAVPVEVHGVELDPQTRCRHWHSPVDIVAIRMKCCDTYFACADCHDALAGHPIAVWPADERENAAILCGACRHELSIAAYMAGDYRCPQCGARFNPGCREHYDRYFASEQQVPNAS